MTNCRTNNAGTISASDSRGTSYQTNKHRPDARERGTAPRGDKGRDEMTTQSQGLPCDCGAADCVRCHGDDAVVECPRCEGTGRPEFGEYQDECAECDGSGEVTVGELKKMEGE